MIKIAVISMCIATFLFALANLIFDKRDSLRFLSQICALSCLCAVGILCGNLNNNFGGFTMLSLLSVFPMFLTSFDFKHFLKKRKEEVEKTDLQFGDDGQKSTTKERYLNSGGLLVFGFASLVSYTALAFAGLYRGYPMAFGFLIGLAFGLAFSFLALIIRKQVNTFDFLSYVLAFVGVGFLIGQFISALMFSLAVQNLVFCAGLVILSVFTSTKLFVENRYVSLLYYIGMIAVFLSIVL